MRLLWLSTEEALEPLDRPDLPDPGERAALDLLDLADRQAERSRNLARLGRRAVVQPHAQLEDAPLDVGQAAKDA